MFRSFVLLNLCFTKLTSDIPLMKVPLMNSSCVNCIFALSTLRSYLVHLVLSQSCIYKHFHELIFENTGNLFILVRFAKQMLQVGAEECAIMIITTFIASYLHLDPLSQHNVIYPLFLI